MPLVCSLFHRDEWHFLKPRGAEACWSSLVSDMTWVWGACLFWHGVSGYMPLYGSHPLCFDVSRASFSFCAALSRVQLFETPWIVARQAPLSMALSRQEYWTGLLFPNPGDLPPPQGSNLFLLHLLHWQTDSFFKLLQAVFEGYEGLWAGLPVLGTLEHTTEGRASASAGIVGSASSTSQRSDDVGNLMTTSWGESFL